MKIIIQTVYENVTNEWLEWYIQKLKVGNVPSAEKLKDGVYLSFSSKDPSSEVIAVTSYELVRELS